MALVSRVYLFSSTLMMSNLWKCLNLVRVIVLPICESPLIIVSIGLAKLSPLSICHLWAAFLSLGSFLFAQEFILFTFSKYMCLWILWPLIICALVSLDMVFISFSFYIWFCHISHIMEEVQSTKAGIWVNVYICIFESCFRL